MGGCSRRRSSFLLLLLLAAGSVLLAGCDFTTPTVKSVTVPAARPSVSVLNPTDGVIVEVNAPLTIRAVATAQRGVRRVDLLVNDQIVDRQSVTILSNRLELNRTWRFVVAGPQRVSLVAYDADGMASDPIVFVVNVRPTTATAPVPAGRPTETPNVIYLTQTPGTPVTPSETPYIVYITATAAPTPTRTATPYVVYVTATPVPTATRTPTLYVLYVTATPHGTAVSSPAATGTRQ